MLRIDETLVGSRTVNCAIREGRDKHTIKVQLQEGVQHRHRAGIAASGLDQTRQPQLGFVCVVERCGFSLTAERTREGTHMLQQACVVCLAFPPPYATSCAVDGELP